MKTYNILSAPKEQVKFPRRRRIVRSRPSLPPPSESQARLTKFGWIRSSSSNLETIDVSGDDEYHLPRPKKRRRKNKFDSKDADQSTMTQFQRGDFPSSERRTANEEIEVWEDDAWLRYQGSPSRQRTPSPSLERGLHDAVRANEVPETSPGGIVASPTSRSPKSSIKDSMPSAKYQTPRKVRFTEVPSSQTPSSTKSSIRRSGRLRKMERSPLGVRSNNVVAVAETQLDSQDQSPSSRKEKTVLERSGISTTVKEGFTTGKASKRPLRRTATIQDSQADDLFDSVTTVALESPVKTLKRITTIQDSQNECSALYDDKNSIAPRDIPVLEQPIDDNDEDDVDKDTSDDEYTNAYDATFDPANSALDRDASRYLWTQTQHIPMSAIAEDSDTDEDDLDQPCVRRESQPACALSDGLEDDTVANGHDTLPIANEDELVIATPRRPATLDETNGLVHHPTANQSTPRPSQLSTVVPTQSSPIRSSPIIKREQNQRPENIEQQSWPDTIPSSPLPLPPWSSPDARLYNKRTDDGIGSGSCGTRASQTVETLVDFSLPPPPPLSSSRRGTPASSLS